MSGKRKEGFVSLDLIFEDLEKTEELIKRDFNNEEAKNIEEAVSLLKKIKGNLANLAEEKEDLDLDMIIENIENAILELSNDPEIAQSIESIKSAKVDLIKYNLKGRKSF